MNKKEHLHLLERIRESKDDLEDANMNGKDRLQLTKLYLLLSSCQRQIENIQVK